jgi:hypothetical protein
VFEGRGKDTEEVRNKYLILIGLISLFAGCASEIDKCVDDNMNAWQDRQNRISRGEKVPSRFIRGEFEELDKRTPTEMRAVMRNMCLQISSGKD